MPSPTPNKPKEMTFSAALGEMVMGKKLTRTSWQNKDYGFMKNDILTIHTADKDQNWIVSVGDIEGNDWKVIS